MGQCNQICQLPIDRFDINQFKMIDPHLPQNISQFRSQNKPKSQSLAKNSKLTAFYQEIFTSQYIFFGYLIQAPDKKPQKDCGQIFCLNGKLPHGEGILILRTRLFYKGYFKMGLLQGKGIQKTQDWSFEGDFQNGDRKFGKFKNNIFSYEGAFHNNQISGKGKIKFENGNIYSGDLLKGKMHGHGKIIYSHGDQYEGEFKENFYDGQGTYVWKSGAIYKGKYKKGKKHGFGILHSNGQKHACCWINNEPVAKPLTYKQYQQKKNEQLTKSKSRKQIVHRTQRQPAKTKIKTQVLIPLKA